MADDSNAKKNKLLELANKKRKAQEEAIEREHQERAKKLKEAAAVDFGDASDEGDLGPAAGAGADLTPAAGPAPVDFGDDDEDEDQELVPSAADRAFIDDDDVAPEERVDFGDYGDDQGLAYDEAEEAAEDMEDELDKLFGRRKRQESGNEAQNRATVENILAQMEVACDSDIQAYENRKPAIHKLRMLPRVQEVLAMKKLHGELLDNGLLAVFKAWLEPNMIDGTLPNSKIRNAVLTMLTRLPIDCSYEDRRDQLKRSELGKVIMFLSKLPDETPENRRMARELVEKWSRPILAPGGGTVDQAELDRILEARQQRQRAAQEKAAEDAADGEDGASGAAALRPGMPGYRFHAAIPQAASLDFVKRPESKVVMVEKRSGTKAGAGEHKITKKLNAMGKKKESRAANVSVEGRNVTIQH
jgi:transcription factor SPN1